MVYRARHRGLGRLVALKTIPPAHLASAHARERFRLEASTASRLDHPNIVPIYEVGERDGFCFYSMKLVEGTTIQQLVSRGMPDAAECRHLAAILVKVAQAVHHAHQRGVLHRDLKPSNVLLDHEHEPHVSDFGLARQTDEDSSLTVSQALIGTPAYLAPEVAMGGARQATVAADIYGLGAIIYQLLTGRPPFAGATLAETLRAVQDADPARPGRLNPAVPADLETICLKCLQKEPAQRYATAEALAEDLARFLRDEPIHARPVTRSERVWRWCRRKPALASFIAATAVLLLAIAVGSPIAIYRINRALKRAEAESLKARRFAYASDMNLAQQAVQADDFYRALQLLDSHRPEFVVPASAGSAPDRSPVPSDRLKAGLQTDLRGWEWRYLWRQCQGEELFILSRYTNYALAVGMLADRKTVFSAGDKSVCLWDLESRRRIGRLLHPEIVIGAAASPDDRWLATASEKEHEGQPVLLWDLATQKIAATLTTNFWLTQGSITFSPDGKWLAFATRLGGLRIWDVRDVNALSEVTNLPAFCPPAEGLGVAFSPDSRTLAYNENDHGAILLWDSVSRSVVDRLTGHQNFVVALAFSPDGKTLASGSYDRTAKLWKLAPGARPSSGAATAVGQQAQELSRARNDAEPAATEDGRTPLNLAERRERLSVTNRSGGFTSLAFSPDGRTLAIGGAGGAGQVIHLIEVATGIRKAELRGHLRGISSLAFTADGQRLLSASDDGTIRVWDPVPRAKETSIHVFARNSINTDWSGHQPALWLSPDGRHLLTVYTNEIFSVWDTLRLAEGERHPLPLTNTTMAAVAPGGRLAAFGNGSGELMLWDAEAGQARLFARPDTNRIHLLVFSQDGRYLAVADDTRTLLQMVGAKLGKTVRVWDLSKQKETHVFTTEGELPILLTFSADAKALVVGFSNGSVKLWQLDGPGGAATFPGHSEWVGGVALLPDGQTLISAESDIHFWDVQTGHETDKLSPRADMFLCVALSPDGRRFAAGAGDGLIRLWDLASHREVATLDGHKESVTQLAFTPDGDHLVSVSKDQLRVWRAPSWADIEAAEKQARN